jgi:hyperosmotically inducible protein
MALAGAGPIGVAAADASNPDQYLKMSAITTRINAKLAAKHMPTLNKIRVDADNKGVVWLTGTAPTQDARDLAASLAKDTDGVMSVHNNVTVP